jgi:hypothetical protein
MRDLPALLPFALGGDKDYYVESQLEITFSEGLSKEVLTVGRLRQRGDEKGRDGLHDVLRRGR